MKLLIAIIFLTLSFTSYSSILIPESAYTFDFNVKMVELDRTKEEKLYGAIDLLRMVFASPEFKQKILHHRYRGRYGFAQSRGLTNRQIYRKILAGVEQLYPYDNNAMDVEVAMYTDNKSDVLGFTRPSTKRIWMNSKYFNKYNSAEVAAHLTHEWLHKLGFDHDRERTPERPYSVPYAVGYIVKGIAGKIYENNYQKDSEER